MNLRADDCLAALALMVFLIVLGVLILYVPG